MRTLKTIAAAAGLAASIGGSTGCMYGGVATAGNNVVITRNDMFLLGLLRHVYVCQVTPQGVSQCMEMETP